MSSLWPVRFLASRHTTAEISATQAEDFESLAQCVEESIPNFKKAEEQQFHSEIAQSYHQAACDVLRKYGQTMSGEITII